MAAARSATVTSVLADGSNNKVNEARPYVSPTEDNSNLNTTDDLPVADRFHLPKVEVTFTSQL
jgi:hypothetical protein